MSASEKYTVTVFCGSAPGFDAVYVEQAAAIGTAIGERGIHLVYGGGHVGLMGTTANAALTAGGTVTGVIPHALQQREAMHHHLTELIVVDTMHERKTIMSERADAFIALPGGPGTLEELTEQWTWAQLGIHEKPCGILNIDGYYDPFIAFVSNMRDRGFTHRRYTDMLVVSDDIDELIERLQAYVPPARVHQSPGAEMSGTELPVILP
ncbi:TIGR00730 family Rossman fold protein [Microbacter sp. GSS18]|nr:TIGR00730 family Rossman fold protein [Microbacter sp. GSS18]